MKIEIINADWITVGFPSENPCLRTATIWTFGISWQPTMRGWGRTIMRIKYSLYLSEEYSGAGWGPVYGGSTLSSAKCGEIS